MSRQDRAETLAETTANAVAAVRAKVSIAAETAEKIDGVLRRAEESLVQLPKQADRIRSAAEPTGRVFTNARDYANDLEDRLGNSRAAFSNAQSYADDINRQLEFAQGGIDALRKELGEAATPLGYAKEFLDELENLPDDEPSEEQAATSGGPSAERSPEVASTGKQPMTTATLRDRLTQLESAMQAATERIGTTAQRLHNARTNVQELRGASVGFENPTASAARVDRVHGNLTNDLAGIQGNTETYAAHYEANQATAKANELAIAVHAGLNPTPRSEQTTPGSAPEDPRRAWSEGRDLGPEIKR
jgi:ABC-type transporter Mla subunit MlaD